MEALFQSLQKRLRPEDVADLVETQLGDSLTGHERAILQRASKGSLRHRWFGFTSMMQEFQGPSGVGPQLERARTLFRNTDVLADVDACSPAAVEQALRALAPEIRAVAGQLDFRHNRLNGEQRMAVGVQESRRKYNRKFRLLRRVQGKLHTLVRETRKHSFTRAAKSGLATQLGREDFMANVNSGCLVAYLTARSNLRSEFTVSGQQRMFDDVAQMLMRRCERDAGARWFAAAHVFPRSDVVARLTDAEKGALLGKWHALMVDVAGMLEETWMKGSFKLHTMVVRRGDDSSTWNATAGAWNKAREGWVAVLQALGAEELLDRMCPGKVMRLMAGDVASWHRLTGGGLDPDTQVWATLPPPWRVLNGEVTCTRLQVLEACARAGVNAEKSGWTHARPSGPAVPFRATPELVHGVTVHSPYLAAWLRKRGAFSGKM